MKVERYPEYQAFPEYRIPVGWGKGLLYEEDDGTLWRARDRFPRNRVLLRITTWKGVAAGASHFYGRLIVDGPEFECLKAGKHTKVGEVAELGGAHELKMPLECRGLNVELERVLTSRELRREEFRDYRALRNPCSSRFDSGEDVIQEARRILDKYFEPGWVLEVR